MSDSPVLVVHGGFGRLEGNFERRDPDTGSTRPRDREFHEALVAVARNAYEKLCTDGARAGAVAAVRALEDDPLFNAGRGSKLQADGQIRMSAGLMDGPHGLFSGVVNVQGLRHPVDMAALLATRPHTVLAGAMATEYGRNHGLELRDPFIPERVAEHERRELGEHGTVGAVARDRGGEIFVATSTGGIGGEVPGRVSDTPTVAGTYASRAAGVSCTGVGEHIVNAAAAARIVVRVEDGATLQQAVDVTVAEANERGHSFGLIALDRRGHVTIGQTRGGLVLYAVHDGRAVRSFHGDAGPP